MELSCQSSGTVKRLILKQLFLSYICLVKDPSLRWDLFAYIVKKDFFSMKSSRLFFLLILFIINCFILVWLIQDRSHVSGLTATTCNSDEFREQFLSPSLYKELSKTTYPGHSFAELLTTTMLDGDFFPKNVSANAAPYLKYKRDEFLLLKKYYGIFPSCQYGSLF